MNALTFIIGLFVYVCLLEVVFHAMHDAFEERYGLLLRAALYAVYLVSVWGVYFK